MLRFHKFTIGWAWTSDYGSPDDPEEFKALYAYSPLPQPEARDGLPADADHHRRPRRPRRAGAQLQVRRRPAGAPTAGPNPTLIRIETRAGHGAGKPVSKMIEEAADELAFLFEALRGEGRGGGMPAGVGTVKGLPGRAAGL